ISPPPRKRKWAAGIGVALSAGRMLGPRQSSLDHLFTTVYTGRSGPDGCNLRAHWGGMGSRNRGGSLVMAYVRDHRPRWRCRLTYHATARRLDVPRSRRVPRTPRIPSTDCPVAAFSIGPPKPGHVPGRTTPGT